MLDQDNNFTLINFSILIPVYWILYGSYREKLQSLLRVKGLTDCSLLVGQQCGAGSKFKQSFLGNQT